MCGFVPFPTALYIIFTRFSLRETKKEQIWNIKYRTNDVVTS